MFAGLIANCAGCLACRLAGSLALTASAVLHVLSHGSFIERFYMFHR
jgi:hypothetical protein